MNISSYSGDGVGPNFGPSEDSDGNQRASLYSVVRYMDSHEQLGNDSWYRPRALNAAARQRVPRTIMQTGRTYADALRRHRQWMLRWSTLNPEYEINFFGDAHAHRFVLTHGSADEIRAFQSLVTGAQRADLFRILYLRTAGGVYADIDEEPYVPLKKVLPANASALISRHMAFEFLVFTPGHSILKEAARIMTANILQQHALIRNASDRRCTTPHTCVILVTGPPVYGKGVVRARRAGGCDWPSTEHCRKSAQTCDICRQAHDSEIRHIAFCHQDGGNTFNTKACNVTRHWDCRNSRPVPAYCSTDGGLHYSKAKTSAGFFWLPHASL